MLRQRLSIKVIAVIGSLVGLVLAGCGGGGGARSSAVSPSGDRTGSVRLLVRWLSLATDSRAIPVGTGSVSATLRVGGDAIATETVNRPAGDTSPTSELTLGFLPIGPATLQVRAYDEPNAGGAVLASKELGIEVRPGPNDPVRVSLDAVSPPVEDDMYVIGGSVTPNPADPSEILIGLNALLGKTDGQPLNGLTLNDFRVYEDDIERPVHSVVQTGSGVSTTSADIAFVLDVTSSMDDEIDGVRDSVIAFAQHIEAQSVNVRLGGVSFRDYVDESFDFTDDYDAFRSWVGNLYSYGGDDTPENDLDAIMAALGGLSWRPGVQRMIVVITDAPMHFAGDGDGYTDYSVSEVVDSLLSAGIVLHSVSNGSRGRSHRECANRGATRRTRQSYPDVSEIAQSTGGLAMDLPGSGYVDLTTLPLREIVLSGYVVKYRAVPTGRDHEIRLVVLLGGDAVADRNFAAHY